jgi:hypothetical protein
MSSDQSELRKRWRRLNKERSDHLAAWAARGYQNPRPIHIPFPDEIRSLTCGAKTRAGTPCKRRDLYKSGRCKLHGGLSTGPKRIKPKLTP